MQPLIVFTDIEAWVISYLRTKLAGRPEPHAYHVYVSNQVPTSRHDRMVIIRRDGGPRLDVVREAVRLGVRVWATSDAEAADLTGLVRGLLASTPGEGPVRAFSEVAGPVTVPEESGQPLRFFTVELIARAS